MEKDNLCIYQQMVRENKTYTKNLYLPQMITFLTNTEMHLKQNK